jgi:hypothetical protein
MSIEQYIDDTRYLQWKDGMYVMLDDMECDYERALVEDSLRGSSWFDCNYNKLSPSKALKDCMGIYNKHHGAWLTCATLITKLTRAQALYIATGETECTTS